MSTQLVDDTQDTTDVSTAIYISIDKQIHRVYNNTPSTLHKEAKPLKEWIGRIESCSTLQEALDDVWNHIKFSFEMTGNKTSYGVGRSNCAIISFIKNLATHDETIRLSIERITTLTCESVNEILIIGCAPSQDDYEILTYSISHLVKDTPSHFTITHLTGTITDRYDDTPF